jgi:hypothetical protein
MLKWQPNYTRRQTMAKTRKHWLVTVDCAETQLVVLASTEHRAKKAAQKFFNQDDWNDLSLDDLYVADIGYIEAE